MLDRDVFCTQYFVPLSLSGGSKKANRGQFFISNGLIATQALYVKYSLVSVRNLSASFYSFSP